MFVAIFLMFLLNSQFRNNFHEAEADSFLGILSKSQPEVTNSKEKLRGKFLHGVIFHFAVLIFFNQQMSQN